MSLKARIRRLEKRSGINSRTPPIEFFDRLVDATLTEEEWQRWLPWINEHWPRPSGPDVGDQAPIRESPARNGRSDPEQSVVARVVDPADPES